MSEPYLGEIRLMSFPFAPRGWASCDGQILPINQHQALFALLGTMFGGNGQINFALPDLRGRVPIHAGDGAWVGTRGGEQAHVLSIAEMPAHSHALNASATGGNAPVPTGNVLARTTNQIYGPPHNLGPLASATVATTGGNQAHLNMQPFLTLNFCIAMWGIFPSPS